MLFQVAPLAYRAQALLSFRLKLARKTVDYALPMISFIMFTLGWSRAMGVVKSLRRVPDPESMRALNHHSFVRQAIFWVFAALCLLLFAGRAAAAPPPAQAATHFTIADFDGDSRPDLASVDVGQSSLRNTHYLIAFHLSGGAGQTVGITAPTGGLQITSRDVNGDSFPDVIVTTAWTNRPVAILLNDGLGNFTAANPAEFQNAFIDSQTSWTTATDEIRDASALPLSRWFSGDCLSQSRSLSVRRMTGRLAPAPCRLSSCASVSRFSGRAPPFSAQL